MKNEKVIELKIGRMSWLAISAAMYITGWAVLFWFAGIVYTFTALILIYMIFFHQEKIRKAFSESKPINGSYFFDLLIFASLTWQFAENGYNVFAAAVFLVFITGLTLRTAKRV